MPKHKDDWLYMHQQIVFAPGCAHSKIICIYNLFLPKKLVADQLGLYNVAPDNALLNPFISAMLKFNMVS